MKKRKMQIMIGFLLIVLVVGGALFAKINKKRIPITYEQFQKYTEKNSIEFQDNREITISAKIGDGCAANIEENVQIEFLEAPSEAVAIDYFNRYYQHMQQFKDDKTAEKIVNLKHYAECIITTDIMYIHIVRIDNTVMDARVPKEKKNVVINVMKDLGYVD